MPLHLSKVTVLACLHFSSVFQHVSAFVRTVDSIFPKFDENATSYTLNTANEFHTSQLNKARAYFSIPCGNDCHDALIGGMEEVTGVKRKSPWSVPDHPKFLFYLELPLVLGEVSSNDYGLRLNGKPFLADQVGNTGPFRTTLSSPIENGLPSIDAGEFDAQKSKASYSFGPNSAWFDLDAEVKVAAGPSKGRQELTLVLAYHNLTLTSLWDRQFSGRKSVLGNDKRVAFQVDFSSLSSGSCTVTIKTWNFGSSPFTTNHPGPLTRLTSLLLQSWKYILTFFLAALSTLFVPQAWPHITYSIGWVWRRLQGESAYEEGGMNMRFNKDSDDEGYEEGSTEAIMLDYFVTVDGKGNRLRTDGTAKGTGSGTGEVDGAGAEFRQRRGVQGEARAQTTTGKPRAVAYRTS
ncbi:hypothetical protein BDZ91DRAFT_721117 [Kalaharituber pfeilii]|nr:hypothetical protein BDZ91DRAFT_721117 [Kalaharituber pfeilii]